MSRTNKRAGLMSYVSVIVFALIIMLTTVKVQAQSNFEISINIPQYDSGNTDHFLISSSADWNHINDVDKHYFYISPNANYGMHTIYADGTVDAKRYITLYNDNTTHPGKLADEDQANVQLTFDGASYWVVDRLSSIDYYNGTDDSFSYIFKRSNNIVLNRMNLKNIYEGILIYGYDGGVLNEDITIQNSRIDEMTLKGIDDDNVGIKLVAAGGRRANAVTKNIHIINNEIKNCNDGIMLQSYEDDNNPTVNYLGTVIDYNQIYVTKAVYTDGSGNITNDENSKWALTENALDLKAGSEDANMPVVITNNKMWGFRETDQNGGGSGSHGSVITAHYGTKNLIIQNNVFFNSNRDVGFDNPVYRAYSVEDVLISENIFYNMGFRPDAGINYVRYFYDSKNVTFEKNTIVDVNAKSHWMSVGYGGHAEKEVGLVVTCNAIIDASSKSGTVSASTTIAGNTFYNTTADASEGTSYPNITDAQMEDLTFSIDNYTNSPSNITLSGVLTTSNSPHYTCSYIPPTSNLPQASSIIGHWDFEGNTNDVSGKGNHGTPTNISYTTDSKVGDNAAVFNGTAVVSLPTNIDETTIKTITFWMKSASSPSDEYHFIHKGGLYIRSRNDGQMKFAAGTASAFASGVVTNNTWIHIAATIEASNIYLYKNGVKVDDGAVSDLVSSTNFFGLGASTAGGSKGFDGKMDDVIFWSTALTEIEINQVMNYQPAEPPSTASNPNPSDGAIDIATDVTLSWTPGNSATSRDVYFGTTNPPPFVQNQSSTTYSPSALLIAGTTYYWRIDEENGDGKAEGEIWSFTVTEAQAPVDLPQADKIITRLSFENNSNDVSGNNNNGTPVGIIYSTDSKVGTASAMFTGSDDNLANVSLPSSIGESSIKTISLWINKTGDAPNGNSEIYLIRKGNLYIRIRNDGQIKFAAGSATAFKSNVVTLENTWTHIVGVIEEKNVYIYVDGVLIDDGAETDLVDTNTDFTIGGPLGSGWGSFYGKIDDVVLWSTALTPQEVVDVMNFRGETLSNSINELNKGLAVSNYPNPFKNSTMINFKTLDKGNVLVQIYNVEGQKVATLTNKIYSSGPHNIRWDASDSPSGIYFVKVQTLNNIVTSKIILIK